MAKQHGAVSEAVLVRAVAVYIAMGFFVIAAFRGLPKIF